MVELVQSAAEDRRDREQERILRRCGPAVAEGSAHRRRGTRPGDARNEGEGLGQPEEDAVARGELGEGLVAAAEQVGDPEDDPEDDQHDRNEPERAEGPPDRVLQEEPDEHDGDGADDDEPAHPHVGIVLLDVGRAVPAAVRGAEVPEPLADDARDIAPEVEQHRELGADLGDRRERRTRVGGGWQQLTRDPQVGARGDGEELGHSLDESQDDRFDKAHGRMPI